MTHRELHRNQRHSRATAESSGIESVTDDQRWISVRSRDRAADGSFVYSVKTTGVYCRPSCGARLANRENVAFHASPAAAEHAGYRPCKRCKPDQAALGEHHTARITDLCRFIETSQSIPTLGELSARAGMSVFHMHRLFKAMTGVTPKQYATAQRARRVRGELRARKHVTDAIHGAGYNSSSRFYANSNTMLGMTPTQYRAGGAGLVLQFAIGACPLGAILVASAG
ncbi:MAG TPA: bifunctional transcriptional activator/DNA repair enzyme AdaA, partial [Polyangiaceae bacterium]